MGPRPSRPVCPEGLRGPRGPPPLGVGPGRALKEGTQAPDGKEPHREPRVPRVPGVPGVQGMDPELLRPQLTPQLCLARAGPPG